MKDDKTTYSFSGVWPEKWPTDNEDSSQPKPESKIANAINKLTDSVRTGFLITMIMLIVISIAITLSGCVTANATLPDGTELSYSRLGNQEIGSFGWDSESKVFYFDRQSSDNETLYQAMNKLVEKIP